MTNISIMVLLSLGNILILLFCVRIKGLIESRITPILFVLYAIFSAYVILNPTGIDAVYKEVSVEPSDISYNTYGVLQINEKNYSNYTGIAKVPDGIYEYIHETWYYGKPIQLFGNQYRICWDTSTYNIIVGAQQPTESTQDTTESTQDTTESTESTESTQDTTESTK